MKYRHAHHAGNFADVHKHVTLLALLAALKRKDKGFLYLETHSGRGVYQRAESAETAGGIARLEAARCAAPQLNAYLARVAELNPPGEPARCYPGSSWLAARELRPQDRGIFTEWQPAEARALERSLSTVPGRPRVRVDTGDGFARLRALLPPPERRGLVVIDPPYEDTREDFERSRSALGESLRRFATGVLAVWYPIKDERAAAGWQAALAQLGGHDLLLAELWLYPRDSRVALNGSGMAIVNPPFRLEEDMASWLAELHSHLDAGHGGGTAIRRLTGNAARR